MNHRNRDTVSERRGWSIRQGRYALALLLVGASVVLMAGASLEGLWLNQVAADGGSTVPIPPPDRPTPQSTDSVPLSTPTPTDSPTHKSTDSNPPETPAPTGEPITPTPSEVPNQESGSGTSVALWFGIGLGAVSLVGVAVGAFILVSSQRPGSGT